MNREDCIYIIQSSLNFHPFKFPPTIIDHIRTIDSPLPTFITLIVDFRETTTRP